MVKTELRLLIPEWVHRHLSARARTMSVGPAGIFVDAADVACFYLAAGLYEKNKGVDGACTVPNGWAGVADWPPVFELPSAPIVEIENADRLAEQFSLLRKSLSAKIRILKSHILALSNPDDLGLFDLDREDMRDADEFAESDYRLRSSLHRKAVEQLEQAEAALVAIEQSEAQLYAVEVLVEDKASGDLDE